MQSNLSAFVLLPGPKEIDSLVEAYWILFMTRSRLCRHPYTLGYCICTGASSSVPCRVLPVFVYC
jgi:hypothetical protein